MNIPSVNDLPKPSNSKQGWPWSVGSKILPETMADGKPWPKISIVTPSYNQGKYIEETICSVLLQGYPNLEYLIIDGGSSDNSVEIIKKYEPWLTYWVSEKDNGQSNAINKGWKRATGKIIAWLNSDDTYLPNCLYKVAEEYVNKPGTALLFGDCYYIDKDSKILKEYVYHKEKPFTLVDYIKDHKICLPQQAVFMNHDIVKDLSYINESYHFKMDRDLFIRVCKKGSFHYLPVYLANFRVHEEAKSTLRNAFKAWKEFEIIRKSYGGSAQASDLIYWGNNIKEYLSVKYPKAYKKCRDTIKCLKQYCF